MATVTGTVHVEAPLAEVWELYFEPSRWASWVDQFARVESADGYPEAGGTLRWHSGPAGRGEVAERVVEHDSRRLHRVEFTDPESSGELETSFGIEGSGTRVTQELSYRLRRRGPLAAITDRLFIRSQMARSLERSLSGLRLEAEEATAAT